MAINGFCTYIKAFVFLNQIPSLSIMSRSISTRAVRPSTLLEYPRGLECPGAHAVQRVARRRLTVRLLRALGAVRCSRRAGHGWDGMCRTAPGTDIRNGVGLIPGTTATAGRCAGRASAILRALHPRLLRLRHGVQPCILWHGLQVPHNHADVLQPLPGQEPTFRSRSATLAKVHF